jgi:hypothetical protein
VPLNACQRAGGSKNIKKYKKGPGIQNSPGFVENRRSAQHLQRITGKKRIVNENP